MSPLRITEVTPPGAWTGPPDDLISLDYDDRHRRRATLRTAGGLRLALDLPAAVVLRQGAALVLEDGRRVEVVAVDEAILVVRAPDARTLLRLAWHIGNRHLAARLEDDRMVIRHDHVIAEMLKNLGASVEAETGPFDPEPGAFSEAARAEVHAQGHGHGGHHHG